MKERAKAKKEKRKAEMAREKAAKAKTSGNKRPKVNSTEPARKKGGKCNIGKAAFDR